MVLEVAFLRVPKGYNHLPDDCWLRVLSFLPERDAANVSASCVRLRGIVVSHRQLRAARVAAAAAAGHRKEGASAVLPAIPTTGSPAVVAVKTDANVGVAAGGEEADAQQNVHRGLFASIRNKPAKSSTSGGSGFTLRRPKKK